MPSATLRADFHPRGQARRPSYVTRVKQFKTLVDTCHRHGQRTNGVLYTRPRRPSPNGKAAMYYQEILEFDSATDRPRDHPEDLRHLPAAGPRGRRAAPQGDRGAPGGGTSSTPSRRAPRSPSTS
ncbi:hypothetical protein [Nonomuraea dietziae]|uniref:hypothetical protein n=1 Tax=Nonomuraea dietziae TaxID=65515 RepID=UPI0031DF015A